MGDATVRRAWFVGLTVMVVTGALPWLTSRPQPVPASATPTPPPAARPVDPSEALISDDELVDRIVDALRRDGRNAYADDVAAAHEEGKLVSPPPKD